MEEKIDVLNELGEFTGEVATRNECHEKGLWHRAVYAFVIDKRGNVLLQKRSTNKKMWPNMWDVTVGVHVDSNEFGRQALIREAKEELGIDIQDDEIKYLISSTSINKKKNIIDKHYNECYLITKEISEVKYFTKKEILERINNNYEGLTEKTGPWNFLKRILNNYML
ncbi:MAG: NUDIX hydrolase [Clostridia bacterium]